MQSIKKGKAIVNLKYLKLKQGIKILGIFCISSYLFGKYKSQKKQILQSEKDGEKYYDYYQLLVKWMKLQYDGKKIEDYFLEEGIQDIAIYGIGLFADLLIESLKESGVNILYGIDKNTLNPDAKLSEIYNSNDNLPEVDCIVVTPFLDFDIIKSTIEKKCDYKIVSIQEIIYSI